MSPINKELVARKSAVERRQEIGMAVLVLIGIDGAKALTAAKISAHLKLSAGAIFRHFASLDEMLEAAVDLAIDLLEASIPSKALPPKERLRQLGLNRIQTVRTHPGISWLLLSDQGLLGVPEPASKRIRGLVRRSRKFISDSFSEANDTGCLAQGVDPKVAAILFIGATHALIRSGNQRSAPRPEVVLESLMGLLFIG
jgi:TetR/AcrR family transcriptional regulator